MGREVFEAVGLPRLMELAEGRPELAVGVVDGDVAEGIAGLEGARVVRVGGPGAGSGHGTFVVGMLAARRGGDVPGICPGCTIVLRPIFGSDRTSSVGVLAAAITACVDRGARIVNVSAGLVGGTGEGRTDLTDALDHALSKGVIVVAAAGNERTIGGSVLTRHPAVIPVVATDLSGRPLPDTNLGSTMARRGLSAPGAPLVGIGPSGPLTMRGTSVAAPLVTGTLALLWSVFPTLTPAALRAAVTGTGRRGTLLPPKLDARRALDALTEPPGEGRR